MNKIFGRNIYQKIPYLFVIILIFLYVINFMTKNSFLLPAVMGGDDSCVFVTFGFSWLNGLIPYRDLFDNKGPVLWLLNMLGFSFLGNELGVFIIEVVFSLLWVGISLVLLRKNIFIAAICLYILFEFLMTSTFEGGNYTEEYAILFNIISVFLYFTSSRKFCFKYVAYGLMGGLCFYLRPNTAAPTVAICILECLENFHAKHIIKICIFSLWGFLLVAVPFSIYFYMHDALFQFYDAILFGNIGYTVNSMMQWHSKFSTFMYEHISWIIIIALLLLSLAYMGKFQYFKKASFVNIFCFVLGLISLRTYPHYLMIMAAPYIFTCRFFFLISKEEYISNYNKILSTLRSAALTKEKMFFTASFIIILFCYGKYSLQLHYNMFSPAKKEAYKKYFADIGVSSDSKILNLGTHQDASIFYYLHVLPQERSFFPQIIQPRGKEYDVYKNIDRILHSNKYDVVLMPSSVQIPLQKYGFECVGKFKDSYIYKKISP